MDKIHAAIFVCFLAFVGSFASVQAESNRLPWGLNIDSFNEAKQIKEILQQPDKDIDLAKIKLTIDKMIDPAIDIEANLKRIDRIVAKIRALLGSKPTSQAKMLAIKKYLYEPGEWNDFQAYRYDFDDPLGTKISNKLLPNYLDSKKGNCVSMPFLFIILGQRMGINVTAAEAPLHIFVKYTDDTTGRTVNLETTSGANPARDEWYRQGMPMTDEALANGVYLRPLTKKETVVVIATVLAENYSQKQEFEKAIAISDVSLEYYSKNINAMLRKGIASFRILKRDFLQKYPTPRDIPVNQRAYFEYLSNSNHFWFAKAEALGWREPGREDEEKYMQTLQQAAKSTN